MTAEEFYKYDQETIPAKDCCLEGVDRYRKYDIAYSKAELIAFAEAYHKKQLSNQWISVNDRLPNKKTRVAVYKLDISLFCMGTAYFNGENFLYDATMITNISYFERISDIPIYPTHWMPLHKPPKNK